MFSIRKLIKNRKLEEKKGRKMASLVGSRLIIIKYLYITMYDGLYRIYASIC